MPVYQLNKYPAFPPIEHAEKDGLLAIGGDLSENRLILAYEAGIFPWYSDNQPILWWSPDPRFVIFTAEVHVSGSMKRILNSDRLSFRMNTAFKEVINHCASIPRRNQDGTWITEEMIEAYIDLHRLQRAWSFETWYDNKLIGGMYGVMCEKYFAGESMFSLEPNASKYALINACEYLNENGIDLLDCQIHSDHLERMGARYIPRDVFVEFLTIKSALQ